MIIADKIQKLRKKNGWTQEEFAEMLNVSRQSVSKWESAQSVPDLDRILDIAKVFGVSTDFLIKDEIESEDGSFVEYSDSKKLTLEEANHYVTLKENSAHQLANAISLFVACAAPHLILVTLHYLGIIPNVNISVGFGISILLLSCAIGVFNIIKYDSKFENFKYIKKGEFEAEYGVVGFAKDRKEKFRATKTKYTSLGVAICIASSIPIFVSVLIDMPGITTIAVAILLLLISTGVNLIVRADEIDSAYNMIIKVGRETQVMKHKNKKHEQAQSLLWLITIALFLGYSFITGDWGRSWIIFIVSAFLSAIVRVIIDMLDKE